MTASQPGSSPPPPSATGVTPQATASPAYDTLAPTVGKTSSATPRASAATPTMSSSATVTPSPFAPGAATPVPTARPSPTQAPPCSTGKIVFSSDRGGDFDLYSIRPDGSGLTQITNEPGADQQPALSPDGLQIAWNATRQNNISDIYRAQADGAGVVRVTDNSQPAEGPAWSSAGDRIVFTGWDDPTSAFNISTMNVDGSNKSRLTTDEVNRYSPDWSPDSKWITFWGLPSVFDLTTEIFIIPVAGGTATPLTSNSFDDRSPAWSP
ncbi:MAG: PD40 domain-containing protein, partial [Chloroflexi bacterium]|nr:PD40 domain-containing protein [Chloroflexota bacterium]